MVMNKRIANLDHVTRISLQAVQSDREEALKRLLCDCINQLDSDIVAEMLIERESMIMRAERLRDRMLDEVGRAQ